MAVVATFTPDAHSRQRVGRQTEVKGTVDPVGTYATGGFAVPPSLFGLSAIDSLECSSGFNGTEFMVAQWTGASDGKIKLGWTGAAVSTELDEITAADTCTGFDIHVTVRGR